MKKLEPVQELSISQMLAFPRAHHLHHCTGTWKNIRNRFITSKQYIVLHKTVHQVYAEHLKACLASSMWMCHVSLIRGSAPRTNKAVPTIPGWICYAFIMLANVSKIRKTIFCMITNYISVLHVLNIVLVMKLFEFNVSMILWTPSCPGRFGRLGWELVRSDGLTGHTNVRESSQISESRCYFFHPIYRGSVVHCQSFSIDIALLRARKIITDLRMSFWQNRDSPICFY